jgi:hypothetical protein
MDIINVIDKLDALVHTSRKVPGTGSRLVDGDKLLELVEQLRLSIPQDIQAAQDVIQKKDSILNQSQIEARRTKNAAEDEFRVRLEKSEVMMAARTKADEVLAQAKNKSMSMVEEAEAELKSSRGEADLYIVQTLRGLEAEMSNLLASVRKGLESLGATVAV